VVKNYDAAVTLLEKLSEEVDNLPSGHGEQNIEKINEQLGKPDIQKIHTINSLRKDIE
jgi:hypothetical protein